MSEMAPEAPASPPKPEGRSVKGALKRKIGPLPTWVWVLIVAALIVAYAWWKSSQASSQASQSPSGPGQVPQFVNQTYTNVEPPAASDQDQDEDKTPKPAPIPIGMPPQPGPDRDRGRPPPWGGGEPPPGPVHGHGIEPPWGRGARERRKRDRRTDKAAA